MSDERYEFKGETKSKLGILAIVGVLLFGLGVFFAMKGEHKEKAPAEKAAVEVSHDEAAAAEHHVAQASEAGEEHGTPWVKRIFASLWMNNVFFTGIGIIGLFFVAIHYAAQAGWSSTMVRIPLAIGHWIPFAGILMLVSWFIVKHDVFHWTHVELYAAGEHGDKIIQGKSPMWYWPMKGGTFPIFFITRMIVFFGLWYLFFTWIKKDSLDMDNDGSVEHWYSARGFSAIFLVIFGVSSSVAAWDWVMSIDAHWFSTMNGWYVFASWWVTGLATITWIVISLKSAGYLKMVNANHLHDLGKYCFAFSIFWTYIWFSQFLLIYYANIPEETIYFVERLKNPPYSWIFYANLFLNFVFPFLLLMTRDAKRLSAMLKVVCPLIIVGHWFDFYNMTAPGIMKEHGGIGFLEIGMTLIFAAAFLFVVLNSLSKMPLVAKHDPLVEESLHHHI